MLQIGKTPIVVNDSRGFYTSRVFAAYLAEGLAMLAQGVKPALIDNAGRMAGMPLGPLALTDEVSVELIYRINRQTRADTGGTLVDPDAERVATRMVEEFGRLGKKSGQGFYDYPEGGSKCLWPGTGRIFPVLPVQPVVDAVIERLIAIQSIEAAKCLEEGVVTRPMDADIGALLGWGYPSFRGGPIGWIDTMGVAEFVAAAERLAAWHGARFAPPPLLERHGGQGREVLSALNRGGAGHICPAPRPRRSECRRQARSLVYGALGIEFGGHVGAADQRDSGTRRLAQAASSSRRGSWPAQIDHGVDRQELRLAVRP
ncbi:MAG: 3-hydroxyacyl-CoA dehydrogenase family protein [Comamonadaceae bacterium]|nr:3-hydroxyacyl-CoA dehydrogenase family protein [Comamonadaceae bacterium]